MARRIRCPVCRTLIHREEPCWSCKIDKAQQAEIELINSRPHRFIDEEGLLPRGLRVKYAYKGVPGVWVVDENGNHWAGTDSCRWQIGGAYAHSPMTLVDPRLNGEFRLRSFPDIIFRIHPNCGSLICAHGEVVVQSKNGPENDPWLDFAREQQDRVLSLLM